jgi:hypothetical protein
MGIFILLLFVSLGCLIVGLIKPAAFSKFLGASVSRKKVGFVFGLATLASFILIGVTGPPTPKSTKVEPTVPTSAKIENAVATQAVRPKEESTIDRLWKALDTSIGTRAGLNVEYSEGSKTAKLTYTIGTAWDENALVRAAYAAFVKFGAEAFKIDGVDAITVNLRTYLQDSYGNKSPEDVVIITMPKTEFEKYDWNSLKYQSISRQMEQSSTKYYIHPGILLKLDPSKLYLSDSIK